MKFLMIVWVIIGGEMTPIHVSEPFNQAWECAMAKSLVETTIAAEKGALAGVAHDVKIECKEVEFFK